MSRSPIRLGSLVLALALLIGLSPMAGPADVRELSGPGAAATVSERRDALTRHVVVVSLDGVGSQALRRLGPDGAPHLWRLLRRGASTLEARTMVEQTVTLPNHTSMVTGRPIYPSLGGHGVTWNDDRPGTTVQRAAGHDVASVFSAVHRSGRTSAVFAAKTKFSLWRRSWPAGVTRFVAHEQDDGATLGAAVADLRRRHRALTFVHLANADVVGHRDGWLSASYLAAVRRLDRRVGRLQAVLRDVPRLRDAVLVVTADHGGTPGTTGHSDARRPADYRIPFLVVGPAVSSRGLYQINPRYPDPGRRQPDLQGRQPVRNGDVANLAARLLGLRPVPGSRFGRSSPLRVAG